MAGCSTPEAGILPFFMSMADSSLIPVDGTKEEKAEQLPGFTTFPVVTDAMTCFIH